MKNERPASMDHKTFVQARRDRREKLARITTVCILAAGVACGLLVVYVVNRLGW